MSATPTRCSIKRRRTRSISALPHSSDTEYSPPKKKARHESDRPKKRSGCNLIDLLCHRLHDSSDYDAIADLKCTSNKDQDILYAMHKIIDDVKSTVKEDVHQAGQKILQVELYLKWLRGLDPVRVAIESILDAKLPGTRQRVSGLGRTAFSTLYHLVDSFMDEVNSHQDGWSFRSPIGPIDVDPLVMTLAEESNDSSTDSRSEDAVRAAEEILEQIDKTLLASLLRYKSECNNQLMARAIGRKEESLSKGCCLLSEQTGFGGTEDMGFSLLVQTRDAMMDWKNEFNDS